MRIRETRGFTLIELLIVVAIIGVIAAIAVPGLLRARASGNEASAIGSMRAITASQAAFSASCGGGFYAATLQVLGTGPSGGAAFISPDLGAAPSVVKSGYTVTMSGDADPPATAPAACNGGEMKTGYHATATPLTQATGNRHFFTNTTGTIFEKPNAPVTAGAKPDSDLPTDAKAIQ